MIKIITLFLDKDVAAQVVDLAAHVLVALINCNNNNNESSRELNPIQKSCLYEIIVIKNNET